MKKQQQLKPNYGPFYAAMYPGLAEIFHRHGYALAVHGSLARDFDLIAVPWEDKVTKAEIVIKEITTIYAVKVIGKGTPKNHGRTAYTLSCGFADCAIDLSFVSTAAPTEKVYRPPNS